MASRFECIITGCVIWENEAFVVGDLHEFGDTWIFNGVTLSGDARWMPGEVECVPGRDKIIDITGVEFFERRGVFVFQRDTSLMNEAAKKYVGVA